MCKKCFIPERATSHVYPDELMLQINSTGFAMLSYVYNGEDIPEKDKKQAKENVVLNFFNNYIKLYEKMYINYAPIPNGSKLFFVDISKLKKCILDNSYMEIEKIMTPYESYSNFFKRHFFLLST